MTSTPIWVRGSWIRLVFPGGGRVEKNAYVFCVLTQFHSRLKRRDIYAESSTRWRDPRASCWTVPRGARPRTRC